jgi:hypothetical protein
MNDLPGPLPETILDGSLDAPGLKFPSRNNRYIRSTRIDRNGKASDADVAHRHAVTNEGRDEGTWRAKGQCGGPLVGHNASVGD